MTSPLELYRADGSLQLDAITKVPCFIGKGSITSETLEGYPSNSIARIAVGADEFLSVGSTEYCFFGAKRDGYQEIFVGSAPGATIDWYKWGYLPPTPGSPFLVWNEGGEVVFDGAQKPLNVAAIAGLGSTALVSGRTYSFIASQVRVENQRFVQYTGVQPNVLAFFVSSTSAHSIRRNGASAQVSDTLVSAAVSGPYSAGSTPVSEAGWTGTYDNGLTTQYLVVDVTHY